MKTKKFTYALLLVVIGVAVISLLITQRTHKTQSEQRAEQIILEYIEAKELDIQPGTKEYRMLMKGILLGEHPDLTGANSVFIRNEAERGYIIEYAARYADLGNQRDYNELDLEEAETETDSNK